MQTNLTNIHPEGRSMPAIRMENGSAIVIVLLIMVVFSIIGIMATNTTVSQLQIARNVAIYKRNFHNAESAAMRAVQVIENADLNNEAFCYLQPIDTIDEDDMLPADGFWCTIGISDDTEVVVVARGVSAGSSLTMGGAQVHSYVVYGRDKEGDGNVIIGMGYVKPY